VATKSLKTYVYVDGFNLYYGALRKTPYKWLDLAKFCQRLLPNDNVAEIKYFTAQVSGDRRRPDSPIRQQLYLRGGNRQLVDAQVSELPNCFSWAPPGKVRVSSSAA
jgi:hypothetical protein